MTIIIKCLRRWMAWVLPRPRLVLGLAVLLAVGSIVAAALKLEVQTSQLELISTDHPLIALSDKLDPFQFSGKATFTLVVQPPNPDRGIAFLNALADRIRKDPDHFLDFFYRIDPELFRKWVLLYLEQDELLQIRRQIERHSELVGQMSRNPDLLSFLELTNSEMAHRMVGELFTGFLDEDEPGQEQEPMDLTFLIKVFQGLSASLSGSETYISPWSAFFKSEAWDLEKEGYFWQGDKRFLLGSVMPRKIPDGVSKTQTSLEVLRDTIRQLQADGFQDVKAGVTGQEALNNDEMITAMEDMTLATWIALVGVVALMAVFFRGLRHPLLITVSLGFGLIWTFGWTALFVGHLNILSIVFAPLLCGLGVDLAIHWFARFEEERDTTGSDRPEIIRKVMERSGPGIVLAGLSTAFSFLPFVLTGFRGLVELGMITGMGILFILLADFTVLPALSLYFSALPSKKRTPSLKPAQERYLLRFSPSAAHAILGCALLLCLVSVFGIRHVQFDLNPLRLQSEKAESVVWERVLVENSERSALSAATFASSPEEVRKKTELFRAQPCVLDVDNVFTLLPEHQAEKIPILRSILAAVPEMNLTALQAGEGQSYASLAPFVAPPDHTEYVAQLIDVLERIRFKMQDEQAKKWGAAGPLIEQMTQVRTLLGQIIQVLKQSSEPYGGLDRYRRDFKKDLVDKWTLIKESAAAPEMTVPDLPRELRDQFLHVGEYLIRVYPKESIWEEGALTRFVNGIRSVDPEVVGDPIALFTFSAAFKRASILASIYALVAISLLLTLTFESLQLTLVALVPLIAGTIWTVGIMGVVGIDFNLANSIFMPLVVGAGVEYGVIILHRWREGRTPPGRLPYSTGKGVVLAALTTTIGFGTLMISHHRGIFSLGFVAWAGSLCVLASAIFILPAILAGINPPARVVVEEQ